KEKWGDEDNVADVFDALEAKFIARGVPVYIGEFGCGNRATERAEAFRRYYLEYVCRAAADRRIALTYWDNGYNTTGHEAFGLFDRATGALYSPSARAAVEAMTRGYDLSDTTRTLQTIYDAAPAAEKAE
ncbi:MAG: glycoside hydrolase family 5 protein, partial [Muribaculaceae bacterium]|nr:glycoside hydrolase family 5 protein [Muribaculaceae bacterium]